jgi:hypothetical protein
MRIKVLMMAETMLRVSLMVIAAMMMAVPMLKRLVTIIIELPFTADRTFFCDYQYHPRKVG